MVNQIDSCALRAAHLALIFCLIDVKQEHAKPLGKMAGFPCSVFLALHLTAIIILQGADLNVESKATQDVTMPNSSAAGASAKQESAVYKLRIEMIKAKILAKLQLDRAPVIKEKPKESRIAALLSNLDLIGEENDENQANDSEDEYYGKTTKIIVFSEKGRGRSLVYEIYACHSGPFLCRYFTSRSWPGPTFFVLSRFFSRFLEWWAGQEGSS